MDSLLDADATANSGYQFASAGRRPATASLDYSEFGGSATAPSSVGRDRSVELADDEVRMLSALAATLLEKLTAAYEAHEHQRVDKKRWKSVKRREQLTVYKERSSDALASDASSDTAAANDGSSSGDKSQLMLMLTGSVPGRMQDALFGLSSSTTLAMKFRSAYAQDASVVDAEVLATIEGPSVDEPFRFLGLKWVLQTHASATKSFVKKRDVVFLEATGTTSLTNGELVGYHIVHSINLNNSRARMTSSASAGGRRSSSSTVVRAKTSIGHLFRQRPSNGGATDTLDVFMRGYYDPQGGMLQFVALNIAAEQMLSTAPNSLECAQLKKLSYAAHQSTRQRRRATTAASGATQVLRDTTAAGSSLMEDMVAAAHEVEREQAAAAAARDGRSSVCAVCARKFGKMLHRGGASCTICALMVCSRCSVTKKLSFTREDNTNTNADIQHLAAHLERSGISLDSSRSSVRPGRASSAVKSALSSALAVSSSKVQSEICQKPMNFCTPCILKTSAQSAAHVAVEELLELQARAHLQCAANHNGGESAAPTPREVLAMHQRARRSTRAGSTQYYVTGVSTTPRFTQHAVNGAMATTSAAATAGAAGGAARTKTPRAKAFSTSSTASSTTSSVVLYEEPAAATA